MAQRRLLLISVHGDPLAKPGGIQSGGQNVYVRQLARHMQMMGWTVDVLTHWSNPLAPSEEPLGPRGRVVRLSGGRKGFVPKALFPELLPSLIEEFNVWVRKAGCSYEVIHSNYWLSGEVGRALARVYDRPQVHTSHSLGIVRAKVAGAKDPRRLAAEREILTQSAAVVVTTQVEGDEIRRFLGGSPQRVVRIPAGIDPALFHPRHRGEARRELGVGGPMIFFAARFEPNKGLAVLLQAFAKVLRTPGCPSRVVL